jgi:hypothetical protein
MLQIKMDSKKRNPNRGPKKNEEKTQIFRIFSEMRQSPLSHTRIIKKILQLRPLFPCAVFKPAQNKKKISLNVQIIRTAYNGVVLL